MTRYWTLPTIQLVIRIDMILATTMIYTQVISIKSGTGIYADHAPVMMV